jgi:hypothetical protein
MSRTFTSPSAPATKAAIRNEGDVESEPKKLPPLVTAGMDDHVENSGDFII